MPSLFWTSAFYTHPDPDKIKTLLIQIRFVIIAGLNSFKWLACFYVGLLFRFMLIFLWIFIPYFYVYE
jgi:hypothetical protein